MPNEGYVNSDFRVLEENIGGVSIETMHYTHDSTIATKIRVYDRRKVKEAYGKTIFEGTVEDLIKRLLI